MDVKKIIKDFREQLTQNALESEGLFIPLGIIGFIGFGFYYFVWTNITPTTYENAYLRIVAMILCFGLILKNYWPTKLRRYLPLYWYITLFYIMPFFFTFMIFKNNFSGVWVQNSMTALFFLILLANWLELIILLVLGVFSGYLLYVLTTKSLYFPDNFFGIIFAYLAVLGVGGLFVYIKIQKQKEKLKTMRTLAVDIAHELRTPLLAINLAADNIKYYLADLIFAYGLAKEAKLPIKELPQSQFKTLSIAVDDIEAETNYSNTIINMMLTNVEQQNIKASDFRTCSIAKCIDEALRRYPFQSDERALVHWDEKNDFEFIGQELLTIHILFNLLKNAIYYIRTAHKGDIHIWLELGNKDNKLYFRDTGMGIAADILPKIFDLFFSRTYHGSGIGLAFCKMVMQSYGGGIDCVSVEGEFTEFVLSFPVHLVKR